MIAVLRPQDILVSLKFLSPATEERTSYATLAESLGMSASEAHAAVRRAKRSGLLIPSATRLEHPLGVQASRPALSELLCYGVRYFLPAEVGALVNGIPTASSAPPLSGLLVPTDTPPHVWEFSGESVQGLAVKPIYPSVPAAAMRDPVLGEWLALMDALRLHTGRIGGLARDEIRRRIREHSHAALPLGE